MDHGMSSRLPRDEHRRPDEVARDQRQKGINDLGAVLRVLAQCEEFVGYFGGRCDDELLPQVRMARRYLEEVCRSGLAVNLTYIVAPPTQPMRLDNIPPSGEVPVDAI